MEKKVISTDTYAEIILFVEIAVLKMGLLMNLYSHVFFYFLYIFFIFSLFAF